jgi:hypothetical protein
MIEYTIYEKKTGIIHTNGIGDFQDISEVLVDETDGIIEGTYNSSEYLIKNGNPVAHSPDKSFANRQMRNNLLMDCDWTQIPDNGLSEETRAAWRTYRQQLRDLPEHPNWPHLDYADFPKSPA